MFEFQREKFNAPLRAGFWRYVRRDDTHALKIACPLCGAEGDLDPMEHTAEYDGTVSPSIVCPGAGCEFHDHGKLLEYEGPPA